MSFFPNLDLSQLIGLAVFGFCTGFGSAAATLTVQYLHTKMKQNTEALKKTLQQEVSISGDQPKTS